jgi:hypothetical protein
MQLKELSLTLEVNSFLMVTWTRPYKGLRPEFWKHCNTLSLGRSFGPAEGTGPNAALCRQLHSVLQTMNTYSLVPLCYKPESLSFKTRSDEFLNLSNPSGCTRPCFWRVKRGRCLGLTIFQPSVSRLSKQCGILAHNPIGLHGVLRG